jgi:4-amino-4-deoxy-L-arabinose transferase-like glycosyltransferase
MTADLIVRPGVSGRSSTLGAAPAVPLTMLAVVLTRLVFVARPPTPDEAGFLTVASQWHVGGTSLYGNYWVDRPPLLIGIFRLADLAGGLTALRVIGALAAAVTVALLASTARRLFGSRAVVPTAVVAAGLLVSPMLGALAVNGELLAAPFIALGIRLAVEAVETDDPLAARGAALGAGFTAVLALLVKQNMADVVVFALVCWVVAWRTRRVSRRTLADLVALAAVGGAVGYAVVMLWAMAHGTSPLGVYEATYPFRVHAGHVLAETPGNTAEVRLSRLGASAVLSGALLVVVAFGVLVVRRARREPVLWALLALGAFAAASIYAGGSYWLHYLIQAVPFVALAAGAIAAGVPAVRARWWSAVLAGIVAVSAAVALTVTLIHPPPMPGAVVGTALADAAQPGDTVLSAFGDADILRATGMTSPYPYLWSLPSRTLDPDMALLRGILAGPDAPTWIVVRGTHTMERLGQHGAAAMIENRYRVVGEVCGRSIYLQRGLVRPALDTSGSCSGLVLP